MAKRQPTKQRQRQIIDAALKIIAEQGLGKFTAAAIAKEVGISDGTIFRHFETKEEIVAAAVSHVEELLFAEFPPTHEDPITRLGLFFLERIEKVTDHPGVALMLLSDQLAQAAGPNTAQRVHTLQSLSAEFIRQCLVEAKTKSLVRDGLSVDDLFVLVHGSALALIKFQDLTAQGEPHGQRALSVWSTLEKIIRR